MAHQMPAVTKVYRKDHPNLFRNGSCSSDSYRFMTKGLRKTAKKNITG